MNSLEIKVAIIEDYPDMRSTIRGILEDEGTHVVAEAGNLEEAVKLVPSFGELQVNAITLDGNFDEEHPGDYSGRSGREVLRFIRELWGDTIVVAAISSENFSLEGTHRVDLFFDKADYEKFKTIPMRIREKVERNLKIGE